MVKGSPAVYVTELQSTWRSLVLATPWTVCVARDAKKRRMERELDMMMDMDNAHEGVYVALDNFGIGFSLLLLSFY